MHRGFNYYYREGLKTASKTVYRNKCFFRYILYFLAEFFGRILIVFNLHFNIANMRQGYVIRKKNQLNFASAFRDVGHRVPFGTYLLTLCFEGLIFIAGIAAVAVLAVILGSIGYAVGKIAAYEDYKLMIALFAAPSSLIAVLYVSVYLLIFSPTAYIIANNDGVSAGETIGACYRTMINKGKMTVFLTYFVSGLLKSLYLGAMGVGGYFLITKLIPESYYTLVIIAWAVISFAGYLTFAPILTLANRVVKEHLFEDIVLDPATAARVNEKVNVSVCNGKRIQPESASMNLASLFEYTEDPYRILETTAQKAHMLSEEVKKSIKEKPLKKKKGTSPKKEKIRKEKTFKAIETLTETKIEEEPAQAQPMPEVIVEQSSATVNPESAAPANQQLN